MECTPNTKVTGLALAFASQCENGNRTEEEIAQLIRAGLTYP